MTRDLDGQPSAGGMGDDTATSAWTAAERALLDAALDFYGAAEGVIDYAGRERPHVRQDAAGFDEVRRTMAALEDRVRTARAAGVSPERIAEISRIEQEIVALILRRGDGAAPTPPDG